MKTLGPGVFFLLYDIPKVKDIEKKFWYSNNLPSFLHSQLDFLQNGHVYKKKDFDNHIVETPPLLYKQATRLKNTYMQILDTKRRTMNIIFPVVLFSSFLMNL